jgi:type II secretory pathway predicted ATPase ExeA/septal ring-binding cell division protein DamX
LCLEHGTTVSFYVSQQKCELLDSLETQVRFSQLVAVVVGARGLGKSFLLEQLQSRLKDEVALANIDASMAMSDEQLDKTISLQLGLSWQDSNVDLDTRIQNTHNEKVLITIDDAHLLSASCLEFILQLNQRQLAHKQPTLFILLAGESSLPVMINRTATFTQHPEMCVVFELEPIQQAETQAIISTFSHPNSAVLKELKSNSKLDYFWQLSKGNPAELNYHMSRWLDEHSPTQIVEVKNQAAPKTVFKAMVYSTLAIMLTTMLVYQDEINQWVSPKANEKNTGPNVALPENSNEPPVSDLDNVVLTAPKKEKDEAQKQFDEELANETQSDEQLPPKAKLDQQKTDQVISDKTNKVRLIDDAQVIKQVKTAEQQKSETRKSKLNQINDQPGLKVTTKSQGSVNSSEAQLNTDKKDISLSSDESSLLSDNSNHYVLQWVGLSNQSAAESYRDSHLAKSQMKIYRRSSKGKILYVIVSDSFSNRALAEFALNDYLQRGVKENPWIKSLALVQKEIKQFEKSQKP